MNFKRGVVAAKKYLNHTFSGAVLHVFNFVNWERGCLCCLPFSSAVTYFFCILFINTSCSTENNSNWESLIKETCYLEFKKFHSLTFFFATDCGRNIGSIFQVFWAYISLPNKKIRVISQRCDPPRVVPGRVTLAWSGI